MSRFPVEAPKRRVTKALESPGFVVVREAEHIGMLRENADGTRTPLTMPNHPQIKGSTLHIICTQARITRDEFRTAYEES